ncbi:MAG: hypothetical protein M1166_03570 [Candidatus Thermoplasmatota archaeon]|nr:hypothetical protein [Candidatus Thermoplasmatota archaeon]
MRPSFKFLILFASDTILLLSFLIYQFTSIFAVEKNYQIQNLTSQNASVSGGIKLYIAVYTHPFTVFFIVAFVSVYVATFVYAYKHIKK